MQKLSRMVEAWYQELIKPGYDFEKATFTPGTGHFTQVVWKGRCGLKVEFALLFRLFPWPFEFP